MILEKQTNSLVLEEGESKGSIGMSLDMDSANVLMQMLSKNLYSDAIGSTIRESASNALDSHRRCNVDKPIVVKFGKNDSGNYEFSVEDFGCGLDDVDVKEIISKYGKSTKRNEANTLGMMGLGFKAPLAYSSSFYFICRKDEIERKYMMYEGEDENTIDLLFENPTKEPNGVKVIVSVDYYDRGSFIEKIKEQLAYFENVYFEVTDGYTQIDNNFVIHRGEHFQYSELASDDRLHLCLDNVYYPIDFTKLGIDSIKFPVGLRFSLTDGIFPVPSRESVRYTKEAKEMILKRIGQVSDFFVEKYNENVKETDDIYSIFDYYNSSARVVKVIDERADGIVVNADLSPLMEYASISIEEPTLKGVSRLPLKILPGLDNYMLKNYSVSMILNQGRIKTSKYKEDVSVRETRDKTLYVYSDKLGGIKKEYIRSVSPKGYDNIYFLRKNNKEFILGHKKDDYNARTYYSMLGLKNVPKEDWRELIKEYQYIISLITSKFIDVDTMVIPQKYLDDRKQKRISQGIIKERRIKLKGEITGKRCTQLERYVEGKNSKLVIDVQEMSVMHRNKNISVYGTLEHAPTMDKLFSVFKKENVHFIVFSEREIKHLENINIHNWIEINKFMKGENKLFKRIVTAHLISKLVSTYRNVFSRMSTIDRVSSNLYNKLLELNTYKQKWHRAADEEIYKAMLEIANNNNLFDESIYSTYKETKALLEKLKFLNPLLISTSYGQINEKNLVDALSDLFKYYKQKLNIDRYKITLNEDLLTEGELSEENVEELIEQI